MLAKVIQLICVSLQWTRNVCSTKNKTITPISARYYGSNGMHVCVDDDDDDVIIVSTDGTNCQVKKTESYKERTLI